MRGTRVAFTATVALALLAVAVTADKPFPTIYDHDSEQTAAFKRGLQQSNVRELFESMHHHEGGHGEEVIHGKISGDAQMSFNGMVCDPGWTGSDCATPICNMTNHHDHGDPPTARIPIDFFYARNATMSFFVYVDNTMHSQEIQLESDSGPIVPRMYLYDGNKKIYNADEQTNGREDAIYKFNFLPVGTYQIQLLADDPKGSLIVNFLSFTHLSTEVGGIPYGVLEDSALHNDYPSVTLYNGQHTVFVAAPVGLEAPGSLSTVSIFSDAGRQPHNLKLDLRYGCHYAYYTLGFSCQGEGHYYARVRGYDFYGHTFNRIHAFRCEIAIPTSAPPTTPAVSTTPGGPVRCLNGGAPIKRPDGSEYCFCRGLYTGNQCGTPTCMNGGEPRGGLCLCKEGFSGNNCERVSCTDDGGSGLLVGTPILTFVLRVNSQLKDIISQVKTAVQKITQDLAYDPAYVAKFGLVTFNNNGSSATMYYGVKSILSALDDAAATTDVSNGCSDLFFGPIYKAFDTFMITNKSPVYVITDAVPTDIDTVWDVYHIDSFYSAPINILFIEPAVNANCDAYDTNAPGFQAMGELSAIFSGMVTMISRNNRASMGDLLYTHMSHTYHKAHLVFADDQQLCQNLPLYIPISIDAHFHELAIVTEGSNITIQLNAPDGTVVPVQTYNLAGVYISWLVGLQTGTWTFTVIPGDIRAPCMVRAYAVEEPSPQTMGQDYHMVFGITPNLNLDAPEAQPLVGFPQSIVAHIENYPFRDPWKLNAEIVVFTDGGSLTGGREFVMASNGVWRSGCSYEIWFPPFYCMRERSNLYFTIFVRDLMGNMIQRAGVFHCSAVRPTLPPQPGTCLNGGVIYNGTCICQEGWTGEFCQTRVCFNNGTLDRRGFCNCPAGTGGEFCQLLRCTQQNKYESFSQTNRHHLFVLDVSKNNLAVLQKLSGIIAEVVRDIRSQERNWISRYFVVGVDSRRVYPLGRVDQFDVGNMQAIFQQAVAFATNSTDVDCSKSVQLYEGIMHHMLELNENSYVSVFSTAKPQQESLTSIIRAIDTVTTYRITVNLFIASNAVNNYVCGTPEDWSIIKMLSQDSNGRLLPLAPNNVYVGLKMLPSLYMSSVVYNKNFADCSSTVSVLVPVDSFVQSIQVYVNGNAKGALTVYRPNGKQSSYVNKVFSDESNQLTLFDIRRPCDGDWEPLPGDTSNSCYQTEFRTPSWNDARTFCSNAGGYLVDDMTAAKDAQLTGYISNRDVWIGLNSLNGTWNWDRGLYHTQDSFDGSTFNKWGAGQGTVDPTKPCVYRKASDGLWYQQDCTASTQYFVCQKHKYTSEYTPNTMDDDDLPAGRWDVTFSSGPNGGGCSMEVRVQSSLQIFSGFVTHLLEDFPEGYATSNTTANRAITHLQGVITPNHYPYLRYAQVQDRYNGTLYNGLTYQYRAGCTYEYLSQDFVCPNSGASDNRFQVVHIGEDENGLPFQRITNSLCQAARQTCGNGGLVYNGLCVCDEYWTGSFCEVPICVNGGSLNTADNKCVCPLGYSGFACQHDACFYTSNVTFSNDGKAFILAIEATTQNQAAVTNLLQNVSSILSSVPGTWFSSYMFVTFDANGVLKTDMASTISDFNQKLSAALANLSSNNGCDLPIFGSLTQALNTMTRPSQSILYLVTTGGSSATDQANAPAFFDAVSVADVQLHYLFVKSTCPNEVASPGVIAVTDLAIGTDGNLLETTADRVAALTAAYLPTLYNGSVVQTPTFRNQSHSCVNLITYQSIGARVNDVFLTVYSQTAVPFVQNADGQAVGMAANHIDAHTVLYQFTPTKQGIYTISLNDPGTCMLQVRIQGGAEIYTSYVPVTASNPALGSHLDNGTAIPQAGPNLLVAHVANERVELQYARLFSPHSAVAEIKFLRFFRRARCAYEFYTDFFTCDEVGYQVELYGVGSTGQPFRRQSYTRCKGVWPSTGMPTPGTVPTVTFNPNTVTTPVPPPLTTAPSKYWPVKADIVILIDRSNAVSKQQYQDTTAMLGNAFKQFNVGPNAGVQIGALLVYGNDYGAFDLATAGMSVLGYQGLENALVSAYSLVDGFPNGVGQDALVDAIQAGTGQDFMAGQYRPNISDHLLLYITTSESPNQDAIKAAQALMNSSTFKFSVAAIAYQGNGANSAPLTQLVGNKPGCVLQSANANDYLSTTATALADLLYNASINNGVFC